MKVKGQIIEIVTDEPNTVVARLTFIPEGVGDVEQFNALQEGDEMELEGVSLIDETESETEEA